MSKLYSSAEVCEVLGWSYRQVDYWARRFWPEKSRGPGPGRERRFSEDDVERLREVAEAVRRVQEVVGA